ncbi:MAG TPA: hypothetical protein DD418_11975 [Pseudomonas sp.]|nr:hypothetical protein [Pseudomonas sp.]
MGCLCGPLRGQARSHRYSVNLEGCAVFVGAGAPAKRPIQAGEMSLPSDNPVVLRDIRHDPAG